ncbi:MAG: hypothetical protein IH946_06535, partial [Bacteroidetes bacterium]|nr:hypothetical protein [Bacteroidota bacterium]
INDVFTISAEIPKLYLSDSLVIGDNRFKALVLNDSVLFSFQLAEETSPNRLDLSGFLINNKDSTMISILPSEVWINEHLWDISRENYIKIKNRTLETNNFYMQHEDQVIALSSSISVENRSDLSITLNRVLLADLLQFQNYQGQSIDGFITGTIRLQDIFNKLGLSADVFVDDLSFGKDTVGSIELILNSKDLKDEITVWALSTDELNSINLIGTIWPDNEVQQFDIDLSLKQYPLRTLNHLLGKHISHAHGIANATLNIHGTSELPNISGTVDLISAGSIVNYLGTHYIMKAARIELIDNKIILNNIELSDTLRNKAIVKGYIQHDHLSDFKLDIDINTDQFIFL